YLYARSAVSPHLVVSLVFLRPARGTLFPYTTLFRSCRARRSYCHGHRAKYFVERSSHGLSEQVRVAAQDDARNGCRECDDPCKRSEEHTSELQSREKLVCRLLLEKKKQCRWQPASE